MLDRINRIKRGIQLKLFCLTHPNLQCAGSVDVSFPIEVQSGGRVCIGERSVISRWVCLRPWGGAIRIGQNCSINSFCHLSGNGGLEIGNHVRIASNCVIVSANHNFDRTDIPIVDQGETKIKTTIEDDCWLGAGVTVLAGVTIGRGCVIGAGSVVTKDVPPYSVVVGVPGMVIKNRRKAEHRDA